MARAWTALFRVAAAPGAAALIAALLALPAAGRAGVAQAFEDSIVALFETKAPAAARVKVAVAKPAGDGREGAALNVFSGFFISEDGKILTNALPERADARVWIEKDGAPYLCEVLGVDPRSNIALIRAAKLPPKFEYIPLRDAPAPRVGSIAFAITHPLDLPPTPKIGLVAGFESEFAGQAFPFTYIRVGMPIGAGEGGSPVFDSRGELIGIAVAAVPDLGASYLVPAKPLRRIARELEERGEVRYGEIPVAFADKPDPASGANVVVVSSIQSESLAEKAGLRVGDALVAMDGEAIGSVDEARDFVFFKDVGSFLLLRARRGLEELEIPLLCQPREKASSTQ